MGLSSVFSGIAAGAIDGAVHWVGDFGPLLILMASLGVVSLVLVMLRRSL